MTDDCEYELGEANAELARHHRDFEQISQIVDDALEGASSVRRYADALRRIRNIVG